MEMTWMETVQLLGLDLLAVMLVVLVGLQVVESAVRSAWETARSRRRRALARRTASTHRSSAATHAATVSWE